VQVCQTSATLLSDILTVTFSRGGLGTKCHPRLAQEADESTIVGADQGKEPMTSLGGRAAHDLLLASAAHRRRIAELEAGRSAGFVALAAVWKGSWNRGRRLKGSRAALFFPMAETVARSVQGYVSGLRSILGVQILLTKRR
jgi:hypothetical protein